LTITTSASLLGGAQNHGEIPYVSTSRSSTHGFMGTPSSSSFHDVVQRDPTLPSSSCMVLEATYFTIPMGQDNDDEEEYYRAMGLVCRFNHFQPRLVDLNDYISSTWIPITQKEISFFLVKKDYSLLSLTLGKIGTQFSTHVHGFG
jgi:hypothetical protein